MDAKTLMRTTTAEFRKMREKAFEDERLAELQKMSPCQLAASADTKGINRTDIFTALCSSNPKDELIKLLSAINEPIKVNNKKSVLYQNHITTVKKNTIPYKGWGVKKYIYKNTVASAGDKKFIGLGASNEYDIISTTRLASRWNGQCTVNGMNTLNQACFTDNNIHQSVLSGYSESTPCNMVPVTFRIRTNVFDEDQKKYFTDIGINMNENWKKLRSQGGAHGRVDCPFTSLAILDYPIKEFARGQEYNSKNFKGLLSAQIDIQWAAINDQGGTILPGVTSVIPIEKLSYLYTYTIPSFGPNAVATEYNGSYWSFENDLVDLYAAMPPYSGVLMQSCWVQGMGYTGCHAFVMARGGYDLTSNDVDPDSCYIFDAQAAGHEVVIHAWNKGAGAIVDYLNSLGVYFLSCSSLNTENDKELTAILPVEFDDLGNLIGNTGYNPDGIPLRAERNNDQHMKMLRGDQAWKTTKGFYTGRLKKKKTRKQKRDKQSKKKDTKKNKKTSKARRTRRTKRR